MPIHFGTDGWRAVISDTFTFNNLRMVAQAIADAVASDHWDKSGNGGHGCTQLQPVNNGRAGTPNGQISAVALRADRCTQAGENSEATPP